MGGSPGDVGEVHVTLGGAMERMENELWRIWSNGRAGEWAVTYVKQRKSWRMSCDVSEATVVLENEHLIL